MQTIGLGFRQMTMFSWRNSFRRHEEVWIITCKTYHQQQLHWVKGQSANLENGTTGSNTDDFREKQHMTYSLQLIRLKSTHGSAEWILKMHQKHAEVTTYCNYPDLGSSSLKEVHWLKVSEPEQNSKAFPGSYQRHVVTANPMDRGATEVAPYQLRWHRQGGECGPLQVPHESISYQSAYSARTSRGLPSRRRECGPSPFQRSSQDGSGFLFGERWCFLVLLSDKIKTSVSDGEQMTSFFLFNYEMRTTFTNVRPFRYFNPD
jgi:hypothetical protein